MQTSSLGEVLIDRSPSSSVRLENVYPSSYQWLYGAPKEKVRVIMRDDNDDTKNCKTIMGDKKQSVQIQ